MLKYLTILFLKIHASFCFQLQDLDKAVMAILLKGIEHNFGENQKSLVTHSGGHKQVSTLAPCGCQKLDGFVRWPLFAGGVATVQPLARTAWTSATSNNTGMNLREGMPSYTGYIHYGPHGRLRNHRAAEGLFTDDVCTSA